MCENFPVYCGQRKWLLDVVQTAAGRLFMPTSVTAVEQCQAIGGATQRVREKRDRLHTFVEDVT